MKLRFLIILLSVLMAGCVSPQIQTGNPQEYELPGLANTTIYYPNGTSVQVVESVINGTEVDFMMSESGEINIKNPVAVDYSGNNVTFNVSQVSSFGRSYAHFDFESPFSGFIAYTQSDGQSFERSIDKNGSVRVILPVNFTTGSRFLGIAQPEPDNVTADASGREVLVWENPYPEHKKISVNYYHESAPMMLVYFLVFLFTASLMIMGYYYLNLRALQKKRALMEKSDKK